MLSLHAHTETFPVRIAHVPVRSYASRVIHVVLWMCFPSKDRACSQPDSENTSLFVVSLGAYRLQANACRSVPDLGPGPVVASSVAIPTGCRGCFLTV